MRRESSLVSWPTLSTNCTIRVLRTWISTCLSYAILLSLKSTRSVQECCKSSSCGHQWKTQILAFELCTTSNLGPRTAKLRTPTKQWTFTTYSRAPWLTKTFQSSSRQMVRGRMRLVVSSTWPYLRTSGTRRITSRCSYS